MERDSIRARGNNSRSPERGRATGREMALVVAPPPPMRRVMKVLKRVQVVYYLTRNGQLEHPHFMEVSHLSNQQLRLKDFIDRLTVLRGRGMPSRYSWSCKRSYKNGYVWNDLTENDIIHPSEGAEYILKGSEILHPSQSDVSEAERFQQLQIVERRNQTVYNPIQKLKPNSSPINGGSIQPKTPLRREEGNYPEETEHSVLKVKDDEEEELDECEEKMSYTSSNVPSCGFSGGVSMRKNSLDHQVPLHRSNPDDDHLSPQSTISSLSSEKGERVNSRSREPSRRFVVVEEGDNGGPAAEMAQGRSSVLLQLIACGGSVAAKGKSIPCLKQQMSRVEGRVGGGLHRGVVCKAAATVAGKVVVVAEEAEMIKYMSENPRFGNLQSEEKEYFSGSILEAMDDQRRGQIEPVLKKSSSYKEERSSKTRLGDAAAETDDQDQKLEKAASACGGGGGGGKSKCIPNPMRKHQRQSKK